MTWKHQPQSGWSGEQQTGRRSIGAWLLYDWANSAFGTVITTFVFAPYFISEIAGDANTGTVLWGRTAGAAALAVALLAPVLGAIADRSGHNRPWIIGFTVLCAIFSAALYFAYPSTDFVAYTLLCFACAAAASDLSLVFYNAMLPRLAPPSRLGRISGWGWALGYVGGTMSLLCALGIQFGVGSPAPGSEGVRAAGPFVAIWYLAFAAPLFFWANENGRSHPDLKASIRAGLGDLANLLTRLGEYGQVLRFLLVFLLVSNGFITLFAFAGIYAAGTFALSIREITIFGVVTNVIAGAGAFLFSFVDDYVGPKRTLFAALAGLLAAGTCLVLVSAKLQFWIFGILLALFVGPCQAACRSFMARLVPEGRETQFFGFYALSGRMTAFLGPFLLAAVTGAAGSQRAGMASILAFFVAALVPLALVEDPTRRVSARSTGETGD